MHPDATLEGNKKKAMYSTGDVKKGIREDNNRSPVAILASLRAK
jgi:hypothetical protein